MRCFIAIDSGGTKTDAVLFEETGHILARSLTQGCNAMDIGIGSACESLLGVLQNLVARIPRDGTLVSIYSGVAATDYFGGELGRYIRPYFPDVTMRFEDDAVNLISGTLGHQDGCGMVCGTGSSLFVRIEGQPLRHIGGKGYLIDTGGSGFELGRDALCMAMRAVDGRCQGTILTELLADMLGEPVCDAVIPKVHRGGRPYIATLAAAVFAGRKAGDWACEEIFDRGASLMADLVWAAEPYFEGPFSVVMGGGIVANFPEYAQAIREKAPARARVRLQTAPPVYGAAVEAMWDAGIPVTEAVRTRFLKEYAQAAAL